MSEVKSKPSKDSTKSVGLFRQSILVLVLILVVAAGVYEYAFARPGFNRMAIKMNDLVEDANASNITNEQLHERLETEPTQSEELADRPFLVETFAVQRGLPFTSFNLYVWYGKAKSGKWQYVGHKANAYPTEQDLPKKPGSGIVVSDGKGLVIQVSGGVGTPPENPYEVPTENSDDGKKEKPKPDSEDKGDNTDSSSNDKESTDQESTGGTDDKIEDADNDADKDADGGNS